MCHLTAISESDFENEVLNCQVPVLVVIEAQWNATCSIMAPIVSELAQDYVNRIKVVTVDIDRHESIARSFGISKVPTFLFFRQGHVVNHIFGSVSRKNLRRILENLLS